MAITWSILKLEKCNGYQNLQKNISNYVFFISFLSHLNGFWVIYKNSHFHCDQKWVSQSPLSICLKEKQHCPRWITVGPMRLSLSCIKRLSTLSPKNSRHDLLDFFFTSFASHRYWGTPYLWNFRWILIIVSLAIGTEHSHPFSTWRGCKRSSERKIVKLTTIHSLTFFASARWLCPVHNPYNLLLVFHISYGYGWSV